MAAVHTGTLFALLFVMFSQSYGQYQPNWESLDKRPLPAWYDDAKIGIFLHWGVFSVPSFGSEWFWWSWQGAKQKEYINFMEKNYPPGFSYADFAPLFTGEMYDPDAWADLFKKSGAKYIVLTSKHHEGWTNWGSKASWNWNSVENGPHRDLTGDLASSIRNRTDLVFGLYHSLFEWFNPIYLADKASGFKSRDYVNDVLATELAEIVTQFEPGVIWSDGDWEAPDTYWNSTGFLAWLYNESPVKDYVVTNDRWGKGCSCQHGGYYTCQDRYNPGKLVNHKWENAMTLDKKSWGYRREAVQGDYLNITELLQQVVSTVSCGGNILINVGPTADGRIMPIFEERLTQLGAWLDVNGQAIYNTTHFRAQNESADGKVWYTSAKMPAANGGTPDVFAIVLEWPDNGKLVLSHPKTSSSTALSMLGYSGKISWSPGSDNQGLTITMPTVQFNQLPSQYAWVFVLQNVM